MPPKPTILLCSLFLLPSCAKSLDPAPDISRAAATVTQRTGLLPDWFTAAASEPLPADLTSTDAARQALTHDPRLRASLQRIAAARAAESHPR